MPTQPSRNSRSLPSWLKIIGLTSLMAMLYGLVHSQATALISLEYFTEGLPQLFTITSPLLLALLWGLVASWWYGLALGAVLALASSYGSYPKCSARSLRFPMTIALIVVGLSAYFVGVLGRDLARVGYVHILEPTASQVPAERHVAFLSVLWAHWASYITAAVATVVLALWIIWQRWRMHRKQA